MALEVGLYSLEARVLWGSGADLMAGFVGSDIGEGVIGRATETLGMTRALWFERERGARNKGGGH